MLIERGSLQQTADKFSMTSADVTNLLQKCRSILREERAKRPRPHLDNKMLASWNGNELSYFNSRTRQKIWYCFNLGLMISGFAKAAQAFSDETFAQRAMKAWNFIVKHMLNKENATVTLLRSCYVTDDESLAVTKP